jgi:hypothetical protein
VAPAPHGGMDTTPPPMSAAVDEFTAAVVEIGAFLSQIGAHMAQSQAINGPGERTIPEILHELLGETFALSVEPVHGDAALGSAGAVMRTALDAIENGIFLVPHQTMVRSLPRRAHPTKKRARQRKR